MRTAPLTDKDLVRIGGANIVEYILDGVKHLETDIAANKLDLTTPAFTPDQKIRINNLLKLLHLLATQYPYDPQTGRLIFEAKTLLDFVHRIQAEIIDPRIIAGKESRRTINTLLGLIVKHLDQWRTALLLKIVLPPGNKHTPICYHPEFYATYKFKPSFLPDDYRSNFFFEAMVKEFCPFTTLIGFHPFSNLQSEFQEKRSLAELTAVNINVELRNQMAIEYADNLRAFRVHGPGENKKYPGSYIMVKGGHHRMRTLFIKYLKGEVDGNLKVLIQLVNPDSFPLSKGDLFSFISQEIAKRHEFRKRV
ncbi:hypothetical protein HYX14_03790 [Candidatus Woesearchaeota archaeon]|nr:hypothetical protein [Candidatus Woesearchaeota archaeon]